MLFVKTPTNHHDRLRNTNGVLVEKVHIRSVAERASRHLASLHLVLNLPGTGPRTEVAMVHILRYGSHSLFEMAFLQDHHGR